MSTPALLRMMDLMERIFDPNDSRILREHAEELGMPLSSTYRMFNSLEKAGFVHRVRRGVYVPGARLYMLASRLTFRDTIARLAKPMLAEIADIFDCTSHMAVLDDNMATYLLKEGRDERVYSRVGMQLEAYYTGVGKVLLASLPDVARRSYLAEGEFVALTSRTKITNQAIDEDLENVSRNGYAIDLEEGCEGMICVAVPVLGAANETVAAISACRYDWILGETQLNSVLLELRRRAKKLNTMICKLAEDQPELRQVSSQFR